MKKPNAAWPVVSSTDTVSKSTVEQIPSTFHQLLNYLVLNQSVRDRLGLSIGILGGNPTYVEEIFIEGIGQLLFKYDANAKFKSTEEINKLLFGCCIKVWQQRFKIEPSSNKITTRKKPLKDYLFTQSDAHVLLSLWKLDYSLEKIASVLGLQDAFAVQTMLRKTLTYIDRQSNIPITQHSNH